MIQDRLNHRPRKVLRYKTPYKVFFSEMSKRLVSLGGNYTCCWNWRNKSAKLGQFWKELLTKCNIV